jgi:L-amino acid N-acyltransferase YncA
MSTFKLVECTLERHGASILDIFNEAIANSTALYEYVPRTSAFMVTWFAERAAGRYPVIGAIDDRGALLGFATYGVFRSKRAYKYTVEHSLYVHKDHRGKGIGDALLKAIIDAAKQQNYHVLPASSCISSMDLCILEPSRNRDLNLAGGSMSRSISSRCRRP